MGAHWMRGNLPFPGGLTIVVLSAFKLPVSDCPKCGSPGRFVGTDHDEADRKISLFTFECDHCGTYVEKKPARESGGRLYRNGASSRRRGEPR